MKRIAEDARLYVQMSTPHAWEATRKRQIVKPFLGILALCSLLQIASELTLHKLRALGEQSRFQASVAATMFALAERFESDTYQSVVALTTGNQEMLIREREECEEAAENFERGHRALLLGGSVPIGGTEVTLAAADDPKVVEALSRIPPLWRATRETHARLVNSHAPSLKQNPVMAEFEDTAEALILGLNDFARILQEQNRRRLAVAVGGQRLLPIGTLLLTILLGAFVYRRMILPLDASLKTLRESESALRSARDDLEQRVAERTVELSQANEEMRRQSELLDSVLQNMGDGVVVADAGGRLVLWNEAASRLLGLHDPESAPASFSSFNGCFRPDMTTPFARGDMPLARAIRGEPSDQVEIRVREGEHPEGVWLSMTGRPLYGVDRALRGGVVVARDMTMRKLAEEALQSANDELERRVKERTQELKEAQRRAVSLARQAGMTEVATDVLHNVGNVLNSVNTSAAVLAEHARALRVDPLRKTAEMLKLCGPELYTFLTEDERGRRLPEYIEKLSQHMASERDVMLEVIGALDRHIQHIRSIVNTQQGYATGASMQEATPLHDLIEDAIRINGAALGRHKVTVERRFEDIPPVMADKNKLLQIMLNLLSNAKYALSDNPPDNRRVVVRLEHPTEDRVRIQVTDNGAGIDPAIAPKIFQHGFTTRSEGHGFGLHSCALAAQAMNGTLEAHSEGPGQGATFTLVFPYRAADAA